MQKIVFLSILWFSACQVPSFCPNEIELFTPEESLPLVKIDYAAESKILMDKIGQQLGTDLCWKTVDFAITLKNGTRLKINLKRECNDGVLRLMNRPPQIRILLNQNEQLLLEHDIFPIDSLKYALRKHLLSKEDEETEVLSIQWSQDTPVAAIEHTFQGIVDGYLLKYEQQAQLHFKQTICELTSAQVNFLQKELPLQVTLGIGRLKTPPPPPLTGKKKKR